jgi:hypothetical protein
MTDLSVSAVSVDYVAEGVPMTNGVGWNGVVTVTQFEGPVYTVVDPVGVASTSRAYAVEGTVPVTVTLDVPGSVKVGPTVQPVLPDNVAGQLPAR